MGRKGIGKLSLFSIAEEIVVETRSEGVLSAFRMSLEDIRSVIQGENGTYEPEALDACDSNLRKGTRLTLRKVRKRLTFSTETGLRKRLARRFAIIGPAHHFVVAVNGTRITSQDRGYYDKLQYIWTYGDQSPILEHCKQLVKSERRDNHFDSPPFKVTGWLGTVAERVQLTDDTGEKGIIYLTETSTLSFAVSTCYSTPKHH